MLKKEQFLAVLFLGLFRLSFGVRVSFGVKGMFSIFKFCKFHFPF